MIIEERLLPFNSANFHERSAVQIDPLDALQADQAFENAPGLYFSKNSKNENTFLLNGFEQRQINVFLDGVPVSVAFDGIIDLSQLSGDDIESIRISRGLPSMLYGTNTLGGSVNIITQRPLGAKKLKIRLEGSDHNRFFGRLGFDVGFGKFKINGYAVLNQAGSYKLSQSFTPLPNESGPDRENSDFKKSSVGFKLYYTLDTSNHFGLNVNVVRNELGIPPNALITRPRYWRFPKWDKNVISLNSEHYFGSDYLLRIVVFLDQYKNVLESFDDNSYSSQTKRYAFTSEYNDYALGGILYHHLDLLSVGITEGVFTFKRDVHGQKPDLTSEFEDYATDLLLLGIEQEINLSNNFRFSLGFDIEYLKPLYADDYEVRDPITLYNVQVSSIYNINQNLSLIAATGTKSRFPTLKELYSEHLGRTIANPNLKEERSLNSHIGLEWKNERSKYQMLVYYNQLNNLITSVQVDTLAQQFQNIGESLLAGFNFYGDIQIGRSNLNLNYTYLYARNLSPDRSSDYLEYRPAHRFNVFWRVPVFQNFHTQVELSITRKQFFQNPDNTSWEKLSNFSLLNLKFDYLFFNEFLIYMRFDNLFDEHYVSEYGLPMPGRELIIGLKMEI